MSQRPARAVLILLLLLGDCAAAAGATEYATINDFVNAATNGNAASARITFDQRDINGDGRADWVAAVVSPGAERDEEVATIYILVQTPSGQYRLDGQSRPFPFHSASGRAWIEIVEVTGAHTFYVQFNARGGACSIEATRYRFKRVQIGWRLSGLDFLSSDSCEDKMHDVSINYLTGQAIEERAKGAKSRKTRSRRSYPVWLLRDFDYNNRYGTEKFLGGN